MNSEQQLLQKLMVSKKIMEKHNDIGRGQSRNINMGNEYSNPILENFEAPSAKYNIPQEYVEESRIMSQPQQNNIPIESKIANSKLPDEIKRLMMEHPIQQSTMGVSSNPVLSNELIEKASRLMNSNAKGDKITESKVRQPNQQTQSPSLSINQMREVIRETVEDVLKENGLLVESESKSNDIFKFRVGEHIFEGRVTKIKKITK